MARIPPPKDARGEPLRALIFDSYYDAYKVGLVLAYLALATMGLHGSSLCDRCVMGGGTADRGRARHARPPPSLQSSGKVRRSAGLGRSPETAHAPKPVANRPVRRPARPCRP